MRSGREHGLDELGWVLTFSHGTRNGTRITRMDPDFLSFGSAQKSLEPLGPALRADGVLQDILRQKE